MFHEQETRLKRQHIRLMRHPETCLYGGVMLMGESSVVDEPDCPTAYTDGTNKRYSNNFLKTLTDTEVAGLALHENLHVVLMHIPRHLDLIKEDAELFNIAADMVVNALIVNLKDKALAKLPEGGYYEEKYIGWSVREVYDDLKKSKQQNRMPQGSGMDKHDSGEADKLTPQQVKELSQKITEALHQGALLASKFGAEVPRAIKDVMETKVDWRDVLRDFITTMSRGAEEYTWRRLNKRRLAQDLYMPTVISERVGEIVVAIDTSGSINGAVLSKFASELVGICHTAQPERVRVLWWDTKVHGEQVFDNYESLLYMLKPQGGGGTEPSCVSEYLIKNRVEADCMVVLTDGFFFGTPKWDTKIPTLWAVTHNKNFKPVSGQYINIDN
jgi:predicted metal-dependent peptidase